MYGGGVLSPPNNFVVSSSIMIKLGEVIEFDIVFSKIIKKISKMTSLLSYDVILCLRLLYPLKFRNSLLWTDLAEIWLGGQILGADSESEVIFYIGGQYQADIGHFLQFCL